MRVTVVIQGEGKGHYSQAEEVIRQLEASGHSIASVSIGRSPWNRLPAYFKDIGMDGIGFFSPGFLSTRDQKGIRVGASILVNLLLSPLYLFELVRIYARMRKDRSQMILNFYEPLGALAGRWFLKRISRVAISHHFYLSHPDFIHPHGLERDFFWQQWLNRIMRRSFNHCLALSFRKGEVHRNIRPIPPIISQRLHGAKISPSDRDLCYFLNRGQLLEAISFYKGEPKRRGLIFTRFRAQDMPPNVELCNPDRKEFLESMLQCQQVITTGGFDTVAEAFYLGLPVYMLPTHRHYEQYCNVLDATRTGMAFQLDELQELNGLEFNAASNAKFRKWVDDFDIIRTLEGLQVAPSH